MKLPGYLDYRFSPPAPSVSVQLESAKLRFGRTLRLLIDTGASTTVVLDRDLRRLGVEWTRLSGPEGQLIGMGGTVHTRLIEDAKLIFKSASGEFTTLTSAIHAARHDLSRLGPEMRKSVMLLPSLLGRDIIERYKFVYDSPRNKVYLEN